MGKRKVFTKTNLCAPHIEHSRGATGNAVILSETIPPLNTMVEFGRNASCNRSFDFSHWYRGGIDAITYACQRQIERFLAGQDSAIEATTVVTYCTALRRFLDYCLLQARASDRDLTLADINRDLTDGYLRYLAGLNLKVNSQRGLYSQTKVVLLAIGRRGLFPLITSGDAATFSFNPFPNTNRIAKGEAALSKRERQAFTAALQQEIQPIWSDDVLVTGELLAYALFLIALYTGRNTTPLLEMRRDCLRPHPKENTFFLSLWKRRGYNTSKVALRAESDAERLLESTPAVRTNVERLIRRVLSLTSALNVEAPEDLKERVWLFRRRSIGGFGEVSALSHARLVHAASRFVAKHCLCDSNGEALRINVSRLRKTFANGIFELTGGDLATTAAALGNTPQVADQSYLAPNEDTRRNWQFMGEVLVQELLSREIGATYRDTPLGHCADPLNGQYAPKRDGMTCMNFMNCLRCKHYAVTAEDLYKVFSFYFRVLSERSRMDSRRWAKEYAHIPRLIDNYIVAEGLRRGTFDADTLKAARERARILPHPFWSVDLVDSLESFT